MNNRTADEEILKPRTDKREYRRIVLENSLQVLLVSDPDTDKSAACMLVSVGSVSDPDGIEGLAHFLMRVLRYASEKCPSEDGYLKYVNEHGGYENSTMYGDSTTYYFEINNESFEEALELFSQFFIKPLMSAEGAMREIKTIESVYRDNLSSDEKRMFQLEKHFSRETHPIHKFDTGNWYTLEVRPNAKGMDIRLELLKFYEENYSANLMNLVVYTKESPDKIQSLVENKFQDIRNPSKHGSYFASHGQPFTSEHLMILVKVVPINEGHKLSVVWPITPTTDHCEEGPCNYLCHVINHEGEGSVYYILKTLGWSTRLSAFEDKWTSELSFFKVTIDLTDAGHEHMQNIVGLLFKYIQFLKQSGVCKRVFDELSAVCKIAFNYQDKISPFGFVQETAIKMQQFPPKYWLAGSSLPSNFNPDLVQITMRELCPENVRIFWESKKFNGDTNKVEPWYGTAYSVEKVTTSVIQQWMSSAPTDELKLPATNRFIPKNLSLKDASEKVKFPVLLRKSSYSKLWYKPDTMFFTPKAMVNIDFICPNTKNSPEAEVLANIFVWLLKDYLNEQAYYAVVAGLHFSIWRTDRGFEVTIFGYNDKLNILLETIIDQFANFEVKLDRFSVIKEMISKDIYNFKFQEPAELVEEYSWLILSDTRWPWKKKLEVLPHLEVKDLVKFTPFMFSKAFLQCFIAGNMEREEAISIIKHVEDILFKGSNPICQPFFPTFHRTNEAIKLQRGMSYLYSEEGLNPSNENSALLHHIQVNRGDFVLNVKLNLFHLIAKKPAYHQLATIEQLGYTNLFYLRNHLGVLGVEFLIQSTMKNPRDLALRVEAFLKNFETHIYEMTNDEFKSNVNALINMELERHKNLRDESGFFWREISRGTLEFDRKEAEVAILRQLTKEEFIDFFDEYIKVGSPRKKTLSVGVYGKKHISDYISEKSEPLRLHSVQINDILSFRKSQPHYSSFKGSFRDMKL